MRQIKTAAHRGAAVEGAVRLHLRPCGGRGWLGRLIQATTAIVAAMRPNARYISACCPKVMIAMATSATMASGVNVVSVGLGMASQVQRRVGDEGDRRHCRGEVEGDALQLAVDVHGCSLVQGIPALHNQSTISAYASQEVLCQD